MPVGLQVYGSHGVLQIDENYKNLVVVASGSKVTGDWTFAGGSYYVQITVTNFVTPLIAFKSDEDVGLGYSSISGSNWTFTFLTNNPAAMSYWVFDQSPSASPGNVGLEVYNNSGERVYHSEQKPMRVAGVGPGTYASGRTYAAIRGDAGMSWTTVPSGLPWPEEWQYDAYIPSAKVASNVITDVGVSVSSALIINDAGNYTSYQTPTLIVDVTNF
jgi:hypothetical protein